MKFLDTFEPHIDILNYTYVSFDPGVTTGVTGWNHEGKPVILREFKQEQLDLFLNTMEETADPRINTAPISFPKVFIYEEYRVWANKFKANVNSELYTVEVIGQIKSFARKHGIEIVRVRADAKDIAARWAQVKVPPGHMPDGMSSYLIGYYDLRTRGIIESKIWENR